MKNVSKFSFSSGFFLREWSKMLEAPRDESEWILNHRYLCWLVLLIIQVPSSKLRKKSLEEVNWSEIKMIVLVFLATVLLGFAVQYLIYRRKFYKFSENIPSPKSLGFGLLGHAPYFLGKDEEGSKQLVWYFVTTLQKAVLHFRSFKNVTRSLLGAQQIH